MESLKQHVQREWKLLPWMLGKLLGGCLAVVGFTGAVLIETRHLKHASLPFALLGIAGVCIFCGASKLLSKRQAQLISVAPAVQRKNRTDVLAWGLLVFIAGAILLWTYFLTR